MSAFIHGIRVTGSIQMMSVTGSSVQIQRNRTLFPGDIFPFYTDPIYVFAVKYDGPFLNIPNTGHNRQIPEVAKVRARPGSSIFSFVFKV
jgi:hypothetical protein